ncbi:Bundle-forming pilus B [Achromobacter sp. 2789STDY5608633]|uniref:PilN family type IVB pilus formation outer membrane protein n=1 Tax=Pseudomonadota TaxID=1224 RepID=UPI0006C67DCB|nr:PilN family type IVB pilus formation outer membrane protein [Achromobacter sp. 2789STDY5608633]CUJ50894.1 Bundle-forming pilus B [Achromobacter sp. 2789STDY5608633]
MTNTRSIHSSATGKRRLPVKLLVGAVAGAVLLSGCSIQRINHAVEKASDQGKTAESYMEDMRNRKQLIDTRSSLRKMDRIWVDTTAQPMSNRSLGAPPTALDCKLTFNPKAPVTLAEFSRVVTNLCGLTVQVTSDATQMLNGTLTTNGQGGGAGAPPAANTLAMSNGELPNPTLGSTGGAIGPTGLYTASTSDSISGISWNNQPLGGLLDLVTARLGLGWKFKDGAATIFYLDTQVFQLYAIPGTTKMETNVKSGAEKGSGSSRGEQTGSFSSDGSSQETGITFETDIVRDIEKTLQTMITPGLGRISVSSSTGTVTVTDRPDVLRRVGEYLKAENKRITRQVLLNVKVLSVQLDDRDSAGLNLDAAYQLVNAQIGTTGGFTAASGGMTGMTGNVGIINESSRWNGTKLFIDALSMQGRVSTLSSPSVTTLNLKPAPILVGTQTTYLAEVSTTAIEGGGSSQQSLTPGTITTGFNMTLLPYLMEGSEMLLQYSVNLSALTGMKTAESGGNKIEMPEVDNRIFSQSVRLRSGETLVLSGFDQSVINGSKQGVGDPSFWMLGGRGDQSTKRDVIVVLITPIVTD